MTNNNEASSNYPIANKNLTNDAKANLKDGKSSQKRDSDRSPQIPHLPFPRMSISHRAKIFMPFDALTGYQAALRKAEEEVERMHENR